MTSDFLQSLADSLGINIDAGELQSPDWKWADKGGSEAAMHWEYHVPLELRESWNGLSLESRVIVCYFACVAASDFIRHLD